jgi:hypothetical protein
VYWSTGALCLMHSEPNQSADLQVFDLLSSGSLVQRIASRHSEVATFRVRTPQGSSLVAVKHLRVEGQRATDSLRSEFLTLRELQKVLGEPLRRTVPRPLLLLENERTIFLSFVPGIPLDVILRRDANVLTSWLNIAGRRRLEGSALRIGEWLNTFHGATASRDQSFDHERFAVELDSLMGKCEPLGFSLSDLASIRAAALNLSASSSGSPVSEAAMHGDFLPQNVLLDDGRLSIVDFASYSPSGPVYTDVAHFIGYLMILAGKQLYSRSAVESVARQFLSGYSRALNQNLLRLSTVRAILRIIADGNRQLSRSTKITLDLLSNILNKGITGLVTA